MSTISTAPERVLTRPEPPHGNYLTHTRGFLSWALTLDHKRIGVMYMVGILASFLIGGLLALAIRAHLFLPNGVGSSRVDLQACKLEYSIVSPK